MLDTPTGEKKEMPKYECHKIVWALKIKRLTDFVLEDRVLMEFENPEYSPIEFVGDWIRKHEPQEGGYYVVYKGGYESYSPAEAFEEGYTLIE